MNRLSPENELKIAKAEKVLAEASGYYDISFGYDWDTNLVTCTVLDKGTKAPLGHGTADPEDFIMGEDEDYVSDTVVNAAAFLDALSNKA